MLLENKNALIYGAEGSVGAGVAKTLAREGATVFLAGRTRAKLDEVAKVITEAGGLPRSPLSMPSTSTPSTSTPGWWWPRRAASTFRSTSLAATSRASLSSRWRPPT